MGTPRNKLSNIVGWASCPPYKLGGQDAHPTRINWIFFYLEVPYVYLRDAVLLGDSNTSCGCPCLQISTRRVFQSISQPSRTFASILKLMVIAVRTG